MNGEHLSPKTRELLDKPIEERIAHIQKDSWIPYSQANKILQQLEDLLQHPKCDRMPNLAISAQTNNGKTRLMKHFLSLHQASETSSGTIAAPVFYVQSPSIPEDHSRAGACPRALLLSRSTITRSKGNGAEHRSIRSTNQRGGPSGVGPGKRRQMPWIVVGPANGKPHLRA
jgi:hypothetical protein